MNAYLELASLLISMAFLAVILSVVGIAVNRIITNIRLSRSERFVSSAAEVARARAYARAQA